MQQIIDQHKKTGDVHHFHLLEGNRQQIQEQLQNFLCDEFGVDPNDKSLFFTYNYDQFQVDDSRALTMQAQIKTPEGKKMIFLVFANSINHQAQNALLKMLEEPSARTYFFIVLPRVDVLLPTFISRAVVVRGGNFGERGKQNLSNDLYQNKNSSNNLSQNLPENPDQNTELPKLNDLQKMTVGDRLKFAEELVKEIKDEKRNKIDARQLIQNLIIEFGQELEQKPDKQKTQQIKKLMQIEDYLGDNGASIKILLERAVLLI